MSAFGKLLRKTTEGYLIWCPGCDQAHHLRVGQKDKPNWTFNEDPEKPKFHPSLMVRFARSGRVCHSFIKNGEWQYLKDSTHQLAGQKVAIPLWEKDDSYDF